MKQQRPPKAAADLTVFAFQVARSTQQLHRPLLATQGCIHLDAKEGEGQVKIALQGRDGCWLFGLPTETGGLQALTSVPFRRSLPDLFGLLEDRLLIITGLRAAQCGGREQIAGDVLELVEDAALKRGITQF